MEVMRACIPRASRVAVSTNKLIVFTVSIVSIIERMIFYCTRLHLILLCTHTFPVYLFISFLLN